MTSRKSVIPSLWLIAGPNGSGKSSLYGSDQNAIYGDTNIADAAHSFWIINPDLLTLRIRSVERRSTEEANLEAVRRIEAWLRASIDALNIKRVQMRVKKGGHDVPVDKIRERWKRSLEQLPWFLDHADWALLFDNSEELRLIGRKANGVVKLDPSAPTAIKDAIAKIGNSKSQ
jgi:predicted ABC-type ATPase